MLDPKLIRQQLEHIAKSVSNRGGSLNVDVLNQLEEQRKALQTTMQELQNERNVQSKKIGQAKAKGEDVTEIMGSVAELGSKLKDTEIEFENLQKMLQEKLSQIPNIPHESVPLGKDEKDNQLIREWGEPRHFTFEPKDHVDLGANLGMDFQNASKMSGARFVVLHDKLAKLQRALAQFMLDIHTKNHGYTEISVPYIVNSESLYGTGQLPKFLEDQFAVGEDKSQFLIPTAEVPVTNLVRDEIIDSTRLPLKFVCYSHCFRSEAGSYGKDTRGMIRQHQFEKVELVQMVHPDNSFEALEELTKHAESILQALKLPYRIMVLCTGDMGFASSKTYDLEVWLPAQNCYREISSCSNMTDFQARRMKARYRDPQGKPELLHTLNGSALAIGRTLVAILENYQDENGNIVIPDVLQKYMDNEQILLSKKA